MVTVLDLSALGTQGFIIQGDVAQDRAGWSVSAAGDVNGDGFGDVIVGAPRGDDGGTDAGEAYVIFGKASGFGTVDLTALAAIDGFIIQGDAASDFAGTSVSGAGDVNGDGFDDLIIGAYGGDDGGFPRTGEAYVVFGKAAPFATVDLATFVPSHPAHTPAAGFIIQGGDTYDEAGKSVALAGDVNGDGFADLLVGAAKDETGASYGGGRAGAAYVIFGSASGFGTVDLTFLVADDDIGFTILGDDNFDEAGFSVAAAGDVNGDGFGDIIIGAPGSEVGAPAGGGAAYVIFGKANGFADIDLSSLAAADGFAILGADGFDNLGMSVSSAGDVNGDGYDDVIVASPETTNNINDGRTAFVVFGKATGLTTVDLAAPQAPTDGFSISVRAGNTGYVITSVSSAGDVNGDGFDDIIVGEPTASSSVAAEDDGVGKAYLLYGRAVWQDVDLANLDDSDGFVIVGDSAGDRAGFSVSAAGDVNDDGFDDLIVGAPQGDDGGTNAGEAYVIFGKSTAPPPGDRRSTDFDGDGGDDLPYQRTSDGATIVLNGEGGFQQSFGVKPLGGILALGDLDGDGSQDLVVRFGSGSILGYSGDDGSIVGNFGVRTAQTLLAVADFDGDGGDDLLFQRSADGATFVVNGEGGFQQSFGYKPVGGIEAVGDFDGDGSQDIAVRQADGKIIGYRGDDAALVAGYGIRTDHILIAIADFDGDGGDDLLFQRSTDGFTSVVNGDGGFQQAFGSKPIGAIEAVGDFDGDGSDDILVRLADGRIVAYDGDGGALLAGHGIRVDHTLIAVADFDGDGGDDLLFQRTSDGGTYVLNGEGGFQQGFGTRPIGAIEAIGDFDGDGAHDIAMRLADGRVASYGGDGSGFLASYGARTGYNPLGSAEDWLNMMLLPS